MTVYLYTIINLISISMLFQFYKEMIQTRNSIPSLNTSPVFLSIGKKTFVVISSMQFIFLSTFRDFTVGADTLTYYRIFEMISRLEWKFIPKFDMEIGYSILNKVIYSLGMDFRVFTMIVSIFIYTVLGIFIFNRSRIPWLSLYLFITLGYFSLMLNVTRQFIAIAITILSLKYVSENRALKFVLVVLLASLFHKSALIFIIVYPITKIKINMKYIMFILFLSILLYFFGSRLVNLLLLLFDEGYTVDSGQGRGMYLLLTTITMLALIIYGLFDKESELQVMLQLMTIAMMLQILTFNLSIISRAVNYFSIYMIILIPNSISLIPSKNIRALSILIVIVLSFMYYLLLLSGDVTGVLPYIFMWNK